MVNVLTMCVLVNAGIRIHKDGVSQCMQGITWFSWALKMRSVKRMVGIAKTKGQGVTPGLIREGVAAPSSRDSLCSEVHSRWNKAR